MPELNLPRTLGAVLAHAADAPEEYVVPMRLPSVSLVSWGDRPLPAAIAAASREGLFLRLDLLTVPDVRRDVFYFPVSTAQPPDLFGQAEELSVVLRSPHRFGRDAGDESTETFVGFQAWDWHMVPRDLPSVWFGRLVGLRGAMPWRNVDIHHARGPRCAVYLPSAAASDVAIMELSANPPEHLLVVDMKSRQLPAVEHIDRLVSMLEFFYGGRLRVEALQGVTDDGRPTQAFFGGAFGGHGRDFAAVPWPLQDLYSCWVAPAYRALAPSMFDGPPIVRLTTEYCLTSMQGPPDEVYLKLTVALEGLAVEVLFDRADATGVARVVGDNLEVIPSQPGVGQSPARTAWHALVASRKWRGSLPEGQRVRAAFAALDMVFDPAMEEEAARWHRARHRAIATRVPGKSIWSQISVLRTMLVGLLMKWLGYSGPIIGYKQDARGTFQQADSGWWGDPSASPAASLASASYVARVPQT